MSSFKTVNDNKIVPSVDMVGDVIRNRPALEFSPTDKVSNILETMYDTGSFAGGVLDSSGSLIGLVTEREMVRKILKKSPDKDQYDFEKSAISEDLTAWDTMITNPTSIAPCASIDDALEIITRNNFRYLPVVNMVGHLKGIVNAKELYRHSQKKAQRLIEDKDLMLSYFLGNEPYCTGHSL